MSLGNKLESFPPAKKVGTILDEFKNFAFKGNVIDLAVGVIIGAAFGAIIKSLVDNIIMPLISLVLPGEKGYEGWQWIVKSHVDEANKVVIDKAIPYGKFLADVVNFLIVAFVLFLFIKKFLGWLMRAKKEEAAAPPMTKDQELLTEIRDLLNQQKRA
jgi:large conductance mechanosensitive channel